MKFTSIALFCDDIRQEASEANSLMGIWPDYVQLGSPEGSIAMARMCVYVRTNVPIEERPEDIEVILEVIGERIIPIATMSRDFVAATIAESVRGGAPNAGFINRAVTGNFPFEKPTSLRVLVKSGDTQIIAGAVRVTPVVAPNASSPPFGQFPPDAPAS